MSRQFVLPAGVASVPGLLEFGATQKLEGTEFERSLLLGAGVHDGEYAALARARAGFHREFQVEPARMFVDPDERGVFSHAAIPLYYIPDLREKTQEADPGFNVTCASSTALLSEFQFLQSLRAIQISVGSAEIGVAYRLSPMRFGIVSDGKSFYLAEERPDALLNDALVSARQTGDPHKVDALIKSLGRLVLDVERRGLSPGGMCEPDNYVVKGGSAMMRNTRWMRYHDAREHLIDDLLEHPKVESSMNELLTGERERKVFTDFIESGRRYP
ncbi:Uncharacterised protein [uncultured archaeon]|nr:Uncharacterised protein [uncultured archaeon]